MRGTPADDADAPSVAGTGAIGTVVVTPSITATVTGVAGTGAVGTVSVTGAMSVTVTGVAGTGGVVRSRLQVQAQLPLQALRVQVPLEQSLQRQTHVTATGVAGTGEVLAPLPHYG